MYNRIDYQRNSRLCNRIYNRNRNRSRKKKNSDNRNRICNRLKKKIPKYDYIIDFILA